MMHPPHHHPHQCVHEIEIKFEIVYNMYRVKPHAISVPSLLVLAESDLLDFYSCAAPVVPELGGKGS
jgi:hypothetical protein